MQNRESRTFLVRRPDSGERIELLALLQELFGHTILDISIERRKHGNLRVKGAVASEAIKSFVTEVLLKAPGVRSVDNQLDVTAPFSPADQDDLLAAAIARRIPTSPEPAETGPNAKNLPEATLTARDLDQPGDIVTLGGQRELRRVDVERHPSIRPITEPTIGELFVFQVDLTLEKDNDTVADPARFVDVSDDWTELLIDVEVFSDQLDFSDSPRNGVIKVRRDQKSLPATFATKILEGAGAVGAVELLVVFSYNTRHSGTACRKFQLKNTEGPNKTANNTEEAKPPRESDRLRGGEPPKDEKAAPSAAIAFPRSVPTPELTVKIISQGSEAEGCFIWSLQARRGTGGANRTATIRLGQTGQAYAAALLDICPNLQPGQHLSSLQGIGQEIWDVSPPEFKSLYVALRNELGPNFPIQIITDETYVPWEMMLPTAASGVVNGNHLFIDHPIARWPVKAENSMPPSLPFGLIATFAPDYGRNNPLPSAQEESQWLIAELGAKPFPATFDGFISFLGANSPNETVSVLHFAGHGSSEAGANSGLRMSDGWVKYFDIRNDRVKLGERDHSFFVANACEIGSPRLGLGGVVGWPQVLTSKGFSGVLMPIWSVDDEHASHLVRNALSRIVKSREPLGEAIRAARLDTYQSSSTPFAYVCYGDVMARIT